MPLFCAVSSVGSSPSKTISLCLAANDTSAVHVVYTGSTQLNIMCGAGKWQPDLQGPGQNPEYLQMVGCKCVDWSWEPVHHQCCFHLEQQLDYRWMQCSQHTG